MDYHGHRALISLLFAGNKKTTFKLKTKMLNIKDLSDENIEEIARQVKACLTNMSMEEYKNIIKGCLKESK